MGSILKSIKQKKPTGDDSALHGMVTDIRARAEADAMSSAKTQVMATVRKDMDALRNQLASTREELSQANAATKVAIGERDNTITLLRAAESASGVLNKRITQLVAAVKLEQETAKVDHASLSTELSDLRGKLSAAGTELSGVQIENAKLNGRIEAIPPKKKAVRKVQRKDPEFTINVTRDALNKISGGTIKVVRPN